ncbi:MAG: UDP-N-acetylmuramate dehydrogenase [Clostridiales bacterium]|nr:UDP-N-acetylmuramate dehydrogenase [Clostridiales bacterium]
MSYSVFDELKNIPGLHIKENEIMANHCSFRIGGTVDALVEPSTEEELLKVIALLRERETRYKLIGLATNLIFSDGHIPMVIVKTSSLCKVSSNDSLLYAQCGCPISRAAIHAYNNGLTGFEFAHGIPGSIGGGVYMNAGAYGGEIASVLESTIYADSDGNIIKIDNEEHMFSYRKSIFSGSDKLILSCMFRLEHGNRDDIKCIMADLMERRKSKQPLEYPSAGSMFKRPEGHFAGKLIEDSGLKGYSIGGAQVSEKHAGFIVNTGNATSDDVLRLVEHIKTVVFNNFGVSLECEPEIVK